MAHAYRVKISRHGVSDNDVWTINSYYRISDERGDRKRRKLLGYTHFWFLYIHICRGKLELQKKSSLAGGVFNFKKLTKDYTKTLLL